MRPNSNSKKTRPTSTSTARRLHDKQATRLLLWSILALVLVLATSFSRNLAAQTLPTPSKCHLERTDLAKYKCLALEGNADAKRATLEAEAALERERAATAREAAAVQQRDLAIDQSEATRTERDREAQSAADCKNRNLELEAKVVPLLVENTLLAAANRKLKQQRWILAAIAGGIGAGAGVFAVIWVTK